MSRPPQDRGGQMAREMAERADREDRLANPSGLSSCLHGVRYRAGENYSCPACDQMRSEAEAEARAVLDAYLAESRSEAEACYDAGTPLAQSSVAEVETTDEAGTWVYIPVAEFLRIAPGARLVSLQGRHPQVVASRSNSYGLAFRVAIPS
jgi:hypothetical protein